MLPRKCVLGVIPPRDVVLDSHSTCPMKKINNQSIEHTFSTRISTHIKMLYYMKSTRKSYKILMPRENVGNARTLTLSIAFRQVDWPILLAKSCPNKRKTTVLAGN